MAKTSLLRARVTAVKALDREMEALQRRRAELLEEILPQDDPQDPPEDEVVNTSDAQIVARGIGDGSCDWSWRSVKDIDDQLAEGVEAWGSTHIEVGQLMRLVHRLLSAELDHVAKINTGELAWEVTFRASRGVKR